MVFFLLVFLYVWRRIRPEVEYVHSTPAFLMSRVFFRQFVAYPGGPVDYAAAFLAQLNVRSWLGAFLFTGLTGLVFLGTREVFYRYSGSRPQMAPFVPPFLLLLLRECPDALALVIGTGLLLSLGLALGYAALALTRTWLRLAACWVGSALLFYVAGFGPCLLFVVLGGLFEVVRRRKRLLGLGCALAGLVVPLWMACCPDPGVGKVLNPWGKGTPLLLALALYLFYPLAVVVLAWRSRSAVPTPSVHPVRRGTTVAPARRWFQRDGLKRAFAATLFLAGWSGIWFAFDEPRQTLREIEYHASRKEHQAVLAAAGRLKTLDVASEVRLHLALCHTGRLLQDLFSFTNQTVWELFPSLSQGAATCRAQSETMLELGQVGVAEHYAHEALEQEGDRPDLLQLLARINVLQDRPKAARVFLNRLRQIPFQGAWAEDYLRRLELDPRLQDDRDLAEIRSRMVKTDLPHNEVPIAAFMRQLLHTNPRNPMAFEYLMAHYLLSREVDKVVEGLGQLNDFGYTAIPRHCEEAILLFAQLQNGAEVDLRGRQLRPETRQRFQRFSEALMRRMHESPEGRQVLAREFGDTFWHYYYFPKQEVTGKAPVRSTESS